MDHIAQINKAFKTDITDYMFAALRGLVRSTEKKQELEFYTGKSHLEWLAQLKISITTGEFLLLLKFFNIEIEVDPEGILSERCLLTKEIYDVKLVSYYSVPFETLHWMHVSPVCNLKNMERLKASNILDMFPEIRETVVGQDEQLKQILFFLHTNLTAIKHNQTSMIPIPKRNMLVTGGTGTGKTFTIQRIAQHIGIPLVEFDVSHLTQSGYVGMDISDVVEALHQNSPDFPQILFLDEFDKLCVLNGDKSNVGTYGGQRSLLKLLEAELMRADGYSKDRRKIDDFNMKNVIIILGGAFSAFSDQVQSENKGTIGFGVGDREKPKDTFITEKELIASGIMPEIAGRLGQVVKMNTLSDTALRQILLTSKEAVIKQFKMLAYYDNEEFNLTSDEIDAIIKESKDLKLGVRGLSTLAEKRYIKQRLK